MSKEIDQARRERYDWNRGSYYQDIVDRTASDKFADNGRSIVIKGVPNECDEQYIVKTIIELIFGLAKKEKAMQEILNYERIGEYGHEDPKRPRPISVTFRNRDIAMTIMESKNLIRGSKVLPEATYIESKKTGKHMQRTRGYFQHPGRKSGGY